MTDPLLRRYEAAQDRWEIAFERAEHELNDDANPDAVRLKDAVARIYQALPAYPRNRDSWHPVHTAWNQVTSYLEHTLAEMLADAAWSPSPHDERDLDRIDEFLEAVDG